MMIRPPSRATPTMTGRRVQRGTGAAARASGSRQAYSPHAHPSAGIPLPPPGGSWAPGRGEIPAGVAPADRAESRDVALPPVMAVPPAVPVPRVVPVPRALPAASAVAVAADGAVAAD